MSFYHLVPISGNSKTGPIAVSTSSKTTCPDSCPLKSKNGVKGLCYAELGHQAINWNKITKGERGGDWDSFLHNVKGLWKGSKFRHNASGDLPGLNEEIDSKKLSQLSSVVKERNLRAWTYSHKPMKGNNLRAVKRAIKSGFIINASANNLKEADEMRKKGLPTVVVVPSDSPEKFVTPGGRRGIVCPAQTGASQNCMNCMLCAKDRTIIIGFRAHGTQKKKVNELVA